MNPFATAVTERRVHLVERALSRVARLDTFLTDWRGHAVELAREASQSSEALFVFSGDGGFNEVLNGVRGETPLGFIPGGGTSVMPRSLGLPRNPLRAAEALAASFAEGRTRRISVGRVNGRRFGFSAGIGLDAELVRRVDELGRRHDGRRPGDLTFAWTTVRVLAERGGRLRPSLEVAGLGRAASVLVSNGGTYSYAGRLPLRVAPEARFELGLDVVAPTSIHTRSLPRLLAYAVRGRGQLDAQDVLYAHDVDRVEVVCDAPMPLQTDGEDLGDVTGALFECERRAVVVLV